MANQKNEEYLVNSEGAWTYMAPIYGLAGALVTQASLTGNVVRKLTSPSGAIGTTNLTISAVVFDTLQTGAPWDSSKGAGYNFIDAVDHTLVTSRGRWLLQYIFTAVSTVQFRSREIDLIAD